MEQRPVIHALHGVVQVQQGDLLKGLAMSAPPLPRATVTMPAPFSCWSILLITTGFTFTLEARKPLVTFRLFLNASMQTSTWTATVNLLEICIISLHFPCFLPRPL